MTTIVALVKQTFVVATLAKHQVEYGRTDVLAVSVRERQRRKQKPHRRSRRQRLPTIREQTLKTLRLLLSLVWAMVAMDYRRLPRIATDRSMSAPSHLVRYVPVAEVYREDHAYRRDAHLTFRPQEDCGPIDVRSVSVRQNSLDATI